MQHLIEYITEELHPIDADQRYDDMLDECYSFDSVGGPFEYMSPSRVLREMDPTAYRCGFSDWLDSEGYIEIDGAYYDADEVEKAREEFVATLDSEAEEIKQEIADLEEEMENAEQEIKEAETPELADFLRSNREAAEKQIALLQEKLDAKQAESLAASRYSF